MIIRVVIERSLDDVMMARPLNTKHSAGQSPPLFIHSFAPSAHALALIDRGNWRAGCLYVANLSTVWRLDQTSQPAGELLINNQAFVRL